MSQQQERVARETAAMPPMPPASASPDERAWAFEQRQAARYGAPTLEDFRRAYQGWGHEWPGEEEVRRRHIVAEG